MSDELLGELLLFEELLFGEPSTGSESDLERAYKSQVDPRLNYEQALEVAMRIVGRAKK